ncbi:MAG: hypothetical protein GY702_20445 [Desulfobulbaceae bacterium]|nr:hypothetical protein [Desulfobulbaceae bacterium]
MLTSSKNSAVIDIGGGWRIRPVAGFHCDALKRICHSINDYEEKDSVISLKSTPDKKVLLQTAQPEPFLIKTHLHLSFGNRLKASLRYFAGREKRKTDLLREFENTRLAHKLGVPTSKMYGYGIKFINGFARQEMLLSNGKSNSMPLIEILKKQAENEKEIEKILQRTFNLISRMLKAGYVHLDLHSDNILLSDSGSGQDIIIDHEFGSLFPDNKMVEVAAFVFGYLYRCQVREYLSFERYAAIVKQVLPSLTLLTKGQLQFSPDFEKLFFFAATKRVPKKKRNHYLRL